MSRDPEWLVQCRGWGIGYNVTLSRCRRRSLSDGVAGMTGANGDGELEESQEDSAGPRIQGRRKVTAALLVAMMVAAMEQLVVSPAMPTIISQLKGFDIYPWV